SSLVRAVDDSRRTAATTRRLGRAAGFRAIYWLSASCLITRVSSPGLMATSKLNFLPLATNVTVCLPGLSAILLRAAIGVVFPVSLASIDTLAHGRGLAPGQPSPRAGAAATAAPALVGSGLGAGAAREATTLSLCCASFRS